jgi:hypothetical protein
MTPADLVPYRRVFEIGTLWVSGQEREAAAAVVALPVDQLRHAFLAAVDIATASNAVANAAATKQASWSALALAWFLRRDPG